MPEELQALLGEARGAGPLDRIEYRDRIAAFGDAAVAEITPWLRDDGLAGFAVRVLERIGREPEQQERVVKVLVGARTGAPETLRGDIDRVLVGFGRRVTRRAPKAASTGDRSE